MPSFQNQVNVAQVPAVEGDFASTNPRASVLAGPGGIVAGLLGVTVGRFAWVTGVHDGDGYPAQANTFGFGVPTGFVHREQQGLNTTYLSQAGMVIPSGFPVTLMASGDYWVKNTGAAQANPGMKAFVNLATGVVVFKAAGGTPDQAASATTSTIAAGTGSGTGTITGNLLNLTAYSAGLFAPGSTISGTGVASGTKITSQVSGTTGQIGTYYVSIGNQTVPSTAISGTHGLFTAGTTTGTFVVGGVLAGGTTAAGTVITAMSPYGTGTGGAGTYIVDGTQTVASATITQTANIESKYIAMSTGALNELVKISSQPLG